MKLESRIEKLEHEFKILKSEIQATLLEIREQILTHYYPALRAEDSTPPTHLQGMAEALRVGQQAQTRLNSLQESLVPNGQSGTGQNGHGHNGKGQNSYGPVEEHKPTPSEWRASHSGVSSAFTDIAYEWMDDLEAGGEDEAYPVGLQGTGTGAPQTREVSLADLKRSQRGENPADLPLQTLPVETASQAHPLDFGALAEWVGESIHQVGKARTQKAVETYAAAVSLPTETQELLFQLIALSDDPNPAEPPNPNGVMEVLVKLDQLWRGQAVRPTRARPR